jgi:NADP-dependent aldehyde dehydrogenase
VTITGEMLIGAGQVRGRGAEFRAIEAATGQSLEPAFHGGGTEDVEAACALAEAAFDTFRETDPEARARFLEAVAANLQAQGAEIVERCMAESGLPRGRLEGELGRTTGQLRLFAAVLREGSWLDARIDPALPDRQPAPRVDLRLRNVPLGPVAVFGASNFPLAFSVAGGDTASALAAGCPVVAKAHNAHPGTSELAGRAIRRAVDEAGLPEGVFSLLFDADIAVGQALVAHPAIKAVGFTGSRRGGLALVQIAQARGEPIPVYAEMSSINPVVLMPAALAARGAAIGSAYVAALTLGAGQFCTNPGIVLAVDGPGLEAFLGAAGEAIAAAPAATMLTPGIHQAFCAGVAALRRHPDVELVAEGREGGLNEGQAVLFATTAEAFRRDHALQAEVFGAASVVVRCRDAAEMRGVLEALEGQLTIAVHADPDDHAAVRPLLPALERKAGRIVFNGFGTGVEVGHAMVHGGPYPATSDNRYTSVGALAIRRFVRPVSYQDAPDALLPPALQDANPQGLPRRRDGAHQPR